MPATMTASVEDIQSQKRVDVLEAYKKRSGVRKKERRLINRQIARIKRAEKEKLDELMAAIEPLPPVDAPNFPG